MAAAVRSPASGTPASRGTEATCTERLLPWPATAQGRWARLREEYGPSSKLTIGDVALQQVRELRRMRTQRVQGTSAFQSINYSVVDNAAQRERVRHCTAKVLGSEKRREFFLIMLVGLFSGLSTVALMKAIQVVHSSHTRLFMGLWKTSGLASWLALAAPNIALFIGSASIVIFRVPAAAGSGIPEVKAYLNGILLPKAWGPKVFVAKWASCLLACAAGMPVGPEGPIIYLGGNIGRFVTSKRLLDRIGLRYTNRLQRTAITLGVAAGVASAFGAPIGALLFVVEEVASIFTTNMLWLGFICSFASYFVTVLLDTVLAGSSFHTEGIFYAGQTRQWQLPEIPNFLILGVFLGLLGAAFNLVNVNVVNGKYRKTVIRVNRRRQIVEVAFLALLISTAWFLLPGLVPCRSKDKEFPEHSTPKNDELKEATKGLWCEDPEAEYNPLATLMFGSLEEIVNYLFNPSNGMDPFPVPVLFLYACLFAIGTCFIAGCSMATGIFIPMIVIGASFGRSYGIMLKSSLSYLGNIDTAAYAVCGAAGFVSGVTRISVAITVIMLEISNDLNLLLPIMLTAGAAKFTGDCLTEPFFDMVLHMRHVPFVEPEPSVAFQQLRCYQVMQRPVVCLPVQVKVMDILKVLSDCTHNGFPVVESMEVKRLHGVITRAHLEVMLTNIEDFLADGEHLTNSPVTSGLMNHYLATHRVLGGQASPVFDHVDAMHLGQELDLHRWMSRAPVAIHQLNTMEQAFFTFRTFGLRQLLVVNSEYLLVGILTRHELFHVQHDPHVYQQQARRGSDLTHVLTRRRANSSMALEGVSEDSPSSQAPLRVDSARSVAGARGRSRSDWEWAETGTSHATGGTSSGRRRPLLARMDSAREWEQTSRASSRAAEGMSTGQGGSRVTFGEPQEDDEGEVWGG